MEHLQREEEKLSDRSESGRRLYWLLRHLKLRKSYMFAGRGLII